MKKGENQRNPKVPLSNPGIEPRNPYVMRVRVTDKEVYVYEV